MKKRRLLFLLVLLVCLIGIGFIWKTILPNEVESSTIKFSSSISGIISSSNQPDCRTNSSNSFSNILSGIYQNIKHPLSILLLQIISIIITARLLGFLFRKIGQPTVIGEIIAGIILGPSLLGLLFPSFSSFLFPLDSLNNLHFLSQIGLILFMFIIGMELDTGFIKNKTDSALIISFGSVLFPFAIGFAASIYLFPEFGSLNSTFFSFAVFMGIAMSITAFPVLARILQEKQLTKTFLGNLAITVAAANDVVGWCLLAAIIAIIKAGNVMGALATIGLSVVFILLMLYVVRPIFKKVGNIYVSKENLNKTIIALVFLFLLLSAYLTEVIGIHALFGAFIAGVVMPKNLNFKNILIEKIEDVSLVLLLPLFFVFTGLRTQIGLLNDPYMWEVCGLIILLAILGKLGGTAIFARMTGQTWKESLSLGMLMNTRGLMELIVLNIGYDLGILSVEIFTMLVIMAIVTTLMTSPSLNFINYLYRKIDNIKQTDFGGLKILLSFANPQMGSKLLKLSGFLSGKENINSEYTAIHLTPASSIETKNISQFEEEVFKPIKTTANEMGVKLNTIYRITELIQKEIVAITNKDRFDLLMVGAAKSVFVENFIGGKIKGLIDKANCDLGIFIDRDCNEFSNVLIISDIDRDAYLMDFAKRIIENRSCKLTIADNNSIHNDAIRNILVESQTSIQNNFEIINTKPDLPFINQFSLVILSLDYWREINKHKSVWHNQLSSLLIVRRKN